jgi:uncharacterized protein YodC (DUF2158 family)
MGKHTFKIGDIVELKSGGPPMTVVEWEDYRAEYRCQWFAGRKMESGHFPAESLIPSKVEDGDKSK